MEPVPLKRTNALISIAYDFLTHPRSGVCVCAARLPCSVAGHATYLGASLGVPRSDDTWFAERAAVIALDWADAAAALALALALVVARPWVLQQAALLPVG